MRTREKEVGKRMESGEERKRKAESKEVSYRTKVRKIRETDSTLRIANGAASVLSPSLSFFFSRERFMGENSTFATISQLISKPRTNLFVNGEIASLYYTSPPRADFLRFLSRENNIIEFLLKEDLPLKSFST